MELASTAQLSLPILTLRAERSSKRILERSAFIKSYTKMIRQDICGGPT